MKDDIGLDFLMVADRFRQTGRTTFIAEALKKGGGTMVCVDKGQADEISKRFGIRTISTNNLGQYQGVYGPLIFDHFVIERIIQYYVNQVESLSKRILELETNSEE